MSIKAVLFDVGGVLLRTEDRSFRDRLEARLGLSSGESEVFVFSGTMGQKAQRGEITIHALWDSVQTHLGLTSAELQQFKDEFWGGDEMDYALIDFIRQLRKKYKTAVISNAFDDLHHTLHNHYQVSDAFDYITVSALEQSMKPDALIYQRTLERLEVEPQEAIFIDDFAHNIEGARTLGIAGIHYRPQMDLVAELEKHGVHA